MAKYTDFAFHFLLYVSTFFFLLIVVLMTLFVLRYRRREGVEAQKSANHNTLLEIVWSVIPLGLVVAFFYVGFTGYMEMRVAPRDAYEVLVIGQKWKWIFRYPNGVEDPNLHVPVDEAVRLTMMSQDVIHSLFIPAFRVKMDLVPGRYTTTWFRAIETGEFDLECTEYCGTGHSDMLAKVVVHSPGEFEAWLAKAQADLENLSPVDAGRLLVTRRCSSCHTSDGTAKIGPTFKGIFGEKHRFTNGEEQVVDENYLRESILNPSIKIREGFPDQMNTFKGQLTDLEIINIIKYIESLK